jgi:hypothetical protein
MIVGIASAASSLYLLIASATSGSPQVAETMTPLLLAVQDAPAPFTGSDGRIHPHPRFPVEFRGSLNLMRLSLKFPTGFADPRGMKRSFLVIHSFTRTNSGRVPHVRTSVRGLRKTGRSPSKVCLFPLSRDEVSSQKGAHVVRSIAAYRKFGASRSFLARCGIPQASPQACCGPHRSFERPKRREGSAVQPR